MVSFYVYSFTEFRLLIASFIAQGQVVGEPSNATVIHRLCTSPVQKKQKEGTKCKQINYHLAKVSKSNESLIELELFNVSIIIIIIIINSCA